MHIGIAMTIRNERPLLRRNMLFHQFVGVDKVYLYLDRTTDGSEETVSDLPFVQVAPTTDPESLRGRPGAATYIAHPDHVTARQALNVIRSMELAEQDGLDWLIHIDADELICPKADSIERDDLKRLFESVGDDIESVQFLPYEACARRSEYKDMLSEETIFTPPGAKGTRTVFDPINNSNIEAALWLGHEKGKGAARVGRGLAPRGPHTFVRLDRSRPRTVNRGLLLHYYLGGFDHFVRKFRNFVDRPDTWINGRSIRPAKRLWRDLVNSPEYTEQQLRDYFERWVLISDEEVDRRMHRGNVMGLPLRKPTLVEIPAASEVIKSFSDVD